MWLWEARVFKAKEALMLEDAALFIFQGASSFLCLKSPILARSTFKGRMTLPSLLTDCIDYQHSGNVLLISTLPGVADIKHTPTSA